MIPPKGFKQEQYPLRHRLIWSYGLSAKTATMNSALMLMVHSSNDMVGAPSTIIVNPHNPDYVEDTGPLVRQMSIIDRLKISMTFNMTSLCADRNETASAAWTGDGITHIHLLWRPIFFSFPEKLDAADEKTTTTVAAILALTKDASKEDVVPLTTTKLPAGGTPSEVVMPSSIINDVQVFGDYNMTTNLEMEEHVWDETLFQTALRKYTNKGALKACVGRTRHVHLTRERPFKKFFIDKPVPSAIRRVLPYGFFGIAVHLPVTVDYGSDFYDVSLTGSKPHLGVKCIAQFHEWNHEHEQAME